jgi:hypothetical protein
MDSQGPLYAGRKMAQSRKQAFGGAQCGCIAVVADSAHSHKPPVNPTEQVVKIH